MNFVDRVNVAAICAAVFAACSPVALSQCPSQQLIPSDAASGDSFGSSVAIAGDVLAIGAPSDDDVGGVNQGSVRVYRWYQTGWVPQRTLLASDGLAADVLGTSVAASGRWIAAGATGADLPGAASAGAVYMFEWNGTTWAQLQKLTSPAPFGGDVFGTSVAMEDGRLVVGAPGVDVSGRLSQGAAYVFRYTPAGWVLEATLTANDGLANDTFGEDVAIHGDRIVVGSDGAAVGGVLNAGAAYVYRRTGNTWVQEQKLVASDGTASDLFGDAVAIGDKVIAVGAYAAEGPAGASQGAAYLFRYNSLIGVWEQREKILAIDAASSDQFGSRVAIDGQYLLIGSSFDDVAGISGTNHGSAHLYRWTTDSGQTNKPVLIYTPPGAASGDGLGESLAISSQFIALGVPQDGDVAGLSQGTVTTLDMHRFLPHNVSVPAAPDEIATLDADDDASLGESVAMGVTGLRALVGAPYTNSTVAPVVSDAGGFVYYRVGAYGLLAPEFFAPPTPVANGLFGWQVGLSSSSAIVSAPGENKLYRYSFGFETLNTPPTSITGPAGIQWGREMAVSDSGTVVVSAVLGDAGRGEVYVYVTGSLTLQQQISSPDAAAGAANFGAAVGVSGETMIVGDDQINSGATVGVGAAYVFLRTGTTWALQQKLNLPGTPLTSAAFGRSVSISGNRAVVGSRVNSSVSALHIFDRVGTTWTLTQTLTGFGPNALAAIDGDTMAVADAGTFGTPGIGGIYRRFGASWYRCEASSNISYSGDALAAAIRGNCAVFGSYSALSPFPSDVRCIMIPGCSDMTDLVPSGDVYNSLGQGVTAAAPIGTVYTNTAAFSEFSSTLLEDGDISVFTRGPIRTYHYSALTLGSGLSIAEANSESGSPAIFGDLQPRTFGYGRISAGLNGSLETGLDSRVLVQSGAALQLYGERMRFRGLIDVDPGATLIAYDDDFYNGRGDVINSGHIFSGGVLNVFQPNAFNPSRMTNAPDGTIDAYGDIIGNLQNDGAYNILGDLMHDGDFTNNGATIVQNGTLSVLGAFANNGTIIGSCAGCRDSLGLFSRGDLTIGAGATLSFPGTAATVNCGGDFDCAIDSNTRYDMASATLLMFATSGSQTLEVMSRDVGPLQSGLDRTIAGNYPIHELRINSLVPVTLVDARDNDGLGQANCEAIYCDTLYIAAHATLINPSCRIYYDALDNQGTVTNPENLIRIRPPCPADFNHDNVINLTDLSILLSQFGAAAPPDGAGDVNGDGVINLTDLSQLLAVFGTLCP